MGHIARNAHKACGYGRLLEETRTLRLQFLHGRTLETSGVELEHGRFDDLNARLLLLEKRDNQKPKRLVQKLKRAGVFNGAYVMIDCEPQTGDPTQLLVACLSSTTKCGKFYIPGIDELDIRPHIRRENIVARFLMTNIMTQTQPKYLTVETFFERHFGICEHTLEQNNIIMKT